LRVLPRNSFVTDNHKIVSDFSTDRCGISANVELFASSFIKHNCNAAACVFHSNLTLGPEDALLNVFLSEHRETVPLQLNPMPSLKHF
jgi:hypothetical protein